MGRRRIYLPVSAQGVADLAQGRDLAPAPLRGCAPPASTPAADLEEAEHDAWLAAAALARDGSSRRVIASVDIDEAEVADSDGGDFAIEATTPIPLRQIVAFHVDETPGGADVDLLWYDVTELAEVAALLTK